MSPRSSGLNGSPLLSVRPQAVQNVLVLMDIYKILSFIMHHL